MRQLTELGAQVEQTFQDPVHAGRDLLLRYDMSPTAEALAPPMRLSEAIETACEEASSEVEKKIRAIAAITC